MRQVIEFTAVDLRDGEQQAKRHDHMSVPDRIRVFDALVDMGMRRIEIGHLSNVADQELARAIITHMGADERYAEVDLQVLFGSRRELIEPGLAALKGWNPEQVIAHVYDRAPACLRSLAATTYTMAESAGRIVAASQVAIEAGYRRFSVSGEGAVDPWLDPDELIDEFYAPVAQRLVDAGATEVNLNLANTFGASPLGEWGVEGLRHFNDRVKRVAGVTTSVHAHDDYGSAADFALAAVEAGFDRIETTAFGMGERRGNTPAVAVMARLLERARATTELAERIRATATPSERSRERLESEQRFWNSRMIAAVVAEALGNWHTSCQLIAEIYDTHDRFERTLVGDPHVFDAGSGPHGQAYAIYAETPSANPVWENYDRSAIPLYMLGCPQAVEVIEVNEERIKHVTLQTHAVGRHTRRIHSGEVEFASAAGIERAIAMARERAAKTLSLISPVHVMLAAD